jgi:hypothetical protein
MTYTVSDETSFFDVDGAFPLLGGGTLEGLRVAYRTWGQPPPGSSDCQYEPWAPSDAV